jgi:hypothetical protein
VIGRRALLLASSLALVSCSANRPSSYGGSDAGTTDDATAVDASVDEAGVEAGIEAAAEVGTLAVACGCSGDGRSIVDCDGGTIFTCTAGSVCDPKSNTCANPCADTVAQKSAVGCEYYAVDMDIYPTASSTYCFAAIVANTYTANAHIQVDYAGQPLNPADFAQIPEGTGSGAPYLPDVGIPPGKVAILFLAGPTALNPGCPIPAAIPHAVSFSGTGLGSAFHIQTDVPIVAYQINPYGGGNSEVTGASLLLPTSTWDTDYIAVNGYSVLSGGAQYDPSLNIVAQEPGTTVTVSSKVPIVGGGPIAAGASSTTFTLDQGQMAQLTQASELTGAVVSASKPIGMFAGHQCAYIPSGVQACDHLEQMVPPIRALGSEYVGAPHPPRGTTNEPGKWRIIGAFDNTTLTWSGTTGVPLLAQGQVVEFSSSTPFVVTSDPSKPFLLFTYMTGGTQVTPAGNGDPDFVLTTPTAQYLSKYVFYADTTYPETRLVFVRKAVGGQFSDIALDCLSTPVAGWQPVGSYEITSVSLNTNGHPIGACNTGPHVATSAAPFGLWVWGWGTQVTSTAWVSYGYPAGMSVAVINDAGVPPPPQ